MRRKECRQCGKGELFGIGNVSAGERCHYSEGGQANLEVSQLNGEESASLTRQSWTGRKKKGTYFMQQNNLLSRYAILFDIS